MNLKTKTSTSNTAAIDHPNWEQYAERIAHLDEYAAEEGIVIDEQSLADFKNLILSEQISCRGALCLGDDGKYIADWNTDDDHCIDLRFYGSQIVSFVLHIPAAGGGKKWDFGLAKIDDVVAKIKTMGLDKLWRVPPS